MHSGNERKFAVAYIAGDRSEVLKVFALECKEAAVAYAKQAAKNYEKGLVCVDLAFFEPGTERRASGTWQMLEKFSQILEFVGDLFTKSCDLAGWQESSFLV